MRRIRKNLIEKLIRKSLAELNEANLSKEEIVMYLSEVLTRIGYSLYYRYERPDVDRPRGQVKGEEVDKLWLQDPTPGSSLMKLGFDVHNVLLRRP